MQAGYHDLPKGHIASVVTHLEMRARPEARPDPEGDFAIERIERPDADWYLGLFRRIGSEYLWLGRLEMEHDALLRIIHDPRVEVYRMTRDGVEAGLLELDFRAGGGMRAGLFRSRARGGGRRRRALADEPGDCAGLGGRDRAVLGAYLFAGPSRRVGVFPTFGLYPLWPSGRSGARSAAGGAVARKCGAGGAVDPLGALGRGDGFRRR